MAATVTIRRWTGTAAAPVKTDVTAIVSRYSTSDNHYTSGTTNPIPVPSTGTNYSYWVSYRLSIDVTPVTTVNNLKFYTDGASSSPAGVTWLCQSANVGADAGYREATGTIGTTGLVLDATNHTGLTAAPVDPFTFTAASPKTLTGTMSNPTTGDVGDFVVVQMGVASTVASTGAVTAETFSFVFDET